MHGFNSSSTKNKKYSIKKTVQILMETDGKPNYNPYYQQRLIDGVIGKLSFQGLNNFRI